MSSSLSEKQKDYLNFLMKYISENHSSPRLEEIAKNFGVKSPTAHKTLSALEKQGVLYFSRDSITGFYIRIPEFVETGAPMFEINHIGNLNRYGILFDFPEKQGHFPAVMPGADPEQLFALELWQHIPEASLQAGDCIIFDRKRKPEIGSLCIFRFGKDWLLVRLYGLTVDEDEPFYILIESRVEILKELENSDQDYFLWWPLAFSEETDAFFRDETLEHQIEWWPISEEDIVAIAVRMDRQLTI